MPGADHFPNRAACGTAVFVGCLHYGLCFNPGRQAIKSEDFHLAAMLIGAIAFAVAAETTHTHFWIAYAAFAFAGASVYTPVARSGRSSPTWCHEMSSANPWRW